MELIVLGSSASFPSAGDACSGYLVKQNGTQILLDCGSGVLGALAAETRLADLTAIVITHFHPDHYMDLVPMRYGLRYSTAAVTAPRLLVPPGGSRFLENVGVALRNSPTMFSASFEIEEYDPTLPLQIGELELRFQRTTHEDPTWAVAVHGAGRLVYSADTRDSGELATFAAGADLLLCESTYPAAFSDVPSDNHLTSLQAGRLAAQAGVEKLLLTHFWPGFDRAEFQAEAEAAFAGPVLLARPGLRLPVVGDAIHEKAGVLAGATVSPSGHRV